MPARTDQVVRPISAVALDVARRLKVAEKFFARTASGDDHSADGPRELETVVGQRLFPIGMNERHGLQGLTALHPAFESG
jgi:hypothetical protein